MGGFHIFDLAVILVIGLAILGPKTLMSLSRKAGEGASHAKDMKDKLMAELPVEELSRVSQNISRIPRIPTSPQQAIKMLVMPERSTLAEPKEAAKAETGSDVERGSQEKHTN